jgi:Zn-dependent protease/predicted transcriptional regulator
VGWSWRLGRVAGIDVYVHATFGFLLAWVAFVSYLPRRDVNDALAGLAFILCLFAIVVLHELGHALAARRYGIRTRDITLLPIGGVARLERIPEEPRQELVVALAGPAVNVVLAGLLYGVLLAARIPMSPPEEVATFGGNLLSQLFLANVFLAVFNMLPAFPMDGGRVLRALLAMRLDYVRATRIAAQIGQGMAILFGILGLMGNPFLLIIALFVWVGAMAESSAVQFRAGLAGVPVEQAMIRDFAALAPDDTLTSAARRVIDGFQQDFPVVLDGRVVGVLPRDSLLSGLAQVGPEGRVGDYMKTDFRTADPHEMLEPVFQRLREAECQVVPVVEAGRGLVGLITPENVFELVMIREAVRGRSVPTAPAAIEHPV